MLRKVYVHAVQLWAGDDSSSCPMIPAVGYSVLMSGVDADTDEVVRNVVFRHLGENRVKALALFEHLSDLLDDGDVFGFTAEFDGFDAQWVVVL